MTETSRGAFAEIFDRFRRVRNAIGALLPTAAVLRFHDGLEAVYNEADESIDVSLDGIAGVTVLGGFTQPAVDFDAEDVTYTGPNPGEASTIDLIVAGSRVGTYYINQTTDTTISMTLTYTGSIAEGDPVPAGGQAQHTGPAGATGPTGPNSRYFYNQQSVPDDTPTTLQTYGVDPHTIQQFEVRVTVSTVDAADFRAFVIACVIRTEGSTVLVTNEGGGAQSFGTVGSEGWTLELAPGVEAFDIVFTGPAEITWSAVAVDTGPALNVSAF